MKEPIIEALELIEKNPGENCGHPQIRGIIDGKLAAGKYIGTFECKSAIYCGCYLLPAGRDRLSESRKSFWQKACDKQPATILQLTLSGVIGLIVGSLAIYIKVAILYLFSWLQAE